jgi:hypothetical protein
MIQDELPPLTALISDDLGPMLYIYRVTFVFGFFLNFSLMLITNYIILMHLLAQKQINFCGLGCL